MSGVKNAGAKKAATPAHDARHRGRSKEQRGETSGLAEVRGEVGGEQRAGLRFGAGVGEMLSVFGATVRPRTGEREGEIDLGIGVTEFARLHDQAVAVERGVDASVAQRFAEETDIKEGEGARTAAVFPRRRAGVVASPSKPSTRRIQVPASASRGWVLR